MTQSPLPTGEQSEDNSELDSRRYSRGLASGKLFRYDNVATEQAFSYTSSDGGSTWDRGGELMRYRGPIQGLDNVSLQVEGGHYKGRIVIPFYMYMEGWHPDYTREERGGYAIYKGEKIRLETHTHVPEMAGAFMVLSDDEGQTWRPSKGFLMGYFDDGHMGFTPGDEPVVAELSDGRLMCYMRSTCGRIVKSYSRDGGESWTKVEPTDLAMSNSPCGLARIPGTTDLVMIWNQMSADEIRRGYRRGRLSLAISTDDGQTWKNFKTLERVSGLNRDLRIEPPPLTSMVRGPSGPDDLLGEIPDDFRHYGYPEIYFDAERISICYKAFPLDGNRRPMRWRTFPVGWLYETEGET